MARRGRWVLWAIFFAATPLWADPCGLVPPIITRTDPNRTLTRIGDQLTYVFFKDGVEDIVLRPAFRGKVSEFGMLIPFPAPPTLRKVPDDIFSQIRNAIDPPLVRVRVPRSKVRLAQGSRIGGGIAGNARGLGLSFRDVKVVSEEAVGMYQVAVLEAGSPEALKRWMTTHGYIYPEGMDGVAGDYVAKGWCFVAVKARIGRKRGVEPRPGMKETRPDPVPGTEFTGAVQAMGFRFRVGKPIVPMRLSAHNPGELHNIVYALTPGPVRFAELPKAFVRRQLSGKELYKKITGVLPARVTFYSRKERKYVTHEYASGEKFTLEGVDTLRDDPTVARKRDPYPYSGQARDLFASDLLAVRKGEMLHSYEEEEKELYTLTADLNLRGTDVDAIVAGEMRKKREWALGTALEDLKEMTLTVIEGDFPREVLKKDDLTFAAYHSPSMPQKQGMAGGSPLILLALFGVLFGLGGRRKPGRTPLIAAAFIAFSAGVALGQGDDEKEAEDLVSRLFYDRTRRDAIQKLTRLGEPALPPLIRTVKDGAAPVPARGAAMVALSRIWNMKAYGPIEGIFFEKDEPILIRLWAFGTLAKLSDGKAVGTLLEYLRHGPLAWQLSRWEDVPPLDRALDQFLRTNLAKTCPDAIAWYAARGERDGQRRLASRYLATREIDSPETRKAFIGWLAYDRDKAPKEGAPWGEKILFIPSVAWTGLEARDLSAHLIHWLIWSEENGDRRRIRMVIRNNLVALAARSSFLTGGNTRLGIEFALAWDKTWAYKPGGPNRSQGYELLVHALEGGGTWRRAEVVKILEKRTQLPYGDDEAKWRAWLEKRKKGRKRTP